MRIFSIPSKKRNRGFTLAEIAIVTLILGLMVVGVLGALTNQINQGRVNATQRQLDEIRDTLLGFAAAKGYLPCPDTDSPADGIENERFVGIVGQRNAATEGTACVAEEGYLPWVTLGVSQTDAWGIRFRYRVTDEFARPTATAAGPAGGLTPNGVCKATAANDPAPTADPNNCTFDIQDAGDIRIDTRGGVTGKNQVTLAGGSATSGIGIPVVIMSFGKNGSGGFDAFGNQRLPLPPANTDESLNFTVTAAGTQRVFVSRISKDSDKDCTDAVGPGPLCEFDDIVTWISAPLLVSKLIQANKLP